MSVMMNGIKVVAKAKHIDWFRYVGIAADLPVQTISSWEEWPGPENDLVAVIHYNQQDYAEAIVETEEEQQYWDELVSELVSHIKTKAPYEEDLDSWHAPNTAVWHAAWTVALEVFYTHKGQAVPAAISAQMCWFERGRWPCSLVSIKSAETENGYIIL